MAGHHLSTAETAILIRQALGKAFPGVKFSVRSRVYSMGSAVDVRWTDGPTTKQVEEIANQYQGGRFDGMIDLAYSVDHWLMPDGSAILARSYGHTYDNEEIEPVQPEGAKLVHFGAKHVMCDRDWSVEYITPIAFAVAEKYGYPAPAIRLEKGSRSAYVVTEYASQRVGSYTFSDLIYQVAGRTPAGSKPVMCEHCLDTGIINTSGSEVFYCLSCQNGYHMAQNAQVKLAEADAYLWQPEVEAEAEAEEQPEVKKQPVRYAGNRPGRRSYSRQGANNGR